MQKPVSPGAGPDFGRPSRPGQGGTRPGLGQGNRPGQADRPGIGDRPGQGNRPGIGERPGQGNRPGIADRPGLRPGFGDRPNNIINNRPGWANIGGNTINNIHNNWNNAIGGIQNWQGRHPDRLDHWGQWGDNIRDNWHDYHHHHDWFDHDWWDHHDHGLCGWHYWNDFHDHDWNYWWTIPAWAGLSSWFAWPAAPATVWSEPIYYDYGQGGNVVYENNNVYVDGQQVATADEFAQSAAVLATVPPPANDAEAAQSDWMPLGTFAVSAGEKDVEPTRVIQLAVNKQGIISGTLYNTQTDKAVTVQGQVDKETQRVAFRVGESEDIVVETGLYNLTQDETPVLVHFGADKVETYLLVRLEQPDNQQGQGS